MKRIKIVICLVFSFWSHFGFGQNTFEGRILDRMTHHAIKDVSVVIGNTIVLTDSTGLFSIISEQPSLSITVQHLSYQTLKSNLHRTDTVQVFFLEPKSVNIDEVIVNTGYESISRERATGSFVHVNREQLEAIPGRSILDKLDGIMPGLQYDRRLQTHGANDPGPTISIRGINTFNALTTQPLIVLDDFPFEGDLETIHPDDIESVTMLRDAAATSIWGSRAGNGVLVITTRKAKPNEQTRVTVSTNVSVIGKPNLRSRSTMTSSEFIDVEKFLYEQGYYTSSLTGSNYNRFIFSPVVHGLYDFDQGLIDQVELDRLIAESREISYRDDMLNYFYRPTIQSQHHVSVGTGVGPYTMNLSAGMNFQEGIGNLVGERFKKTYSFKLDNSYQIFKNLRAELGINYSNTHEYTVNGSTYPLNIGGGRTEAYPYLKLVDESGAGINIPMGYNPRFVETAESLGLLDWTFNPLQDQEQAYQEGNITNLLPSAKLRYTVHDGINLEATYSGNFRFRDAATVYRAESYHVRNEINRFTRLTGGQALSPIPRGGILNSGKLVQVGNRFRLQGRVDKQLLGQVHLNMLLGSEVTDISTESSAYNAYGYDPYRKISTPVDHTTRFPLYFGGTASISNGQGFSRIDQHLVSFYGNSSISLLDKYIISGSVRKDASNAFGVKANERWNPLWSIGMAWKLNREGFLQNVDWISNLQIRATHGHSGNLGGGATSDRVILYYFSSANYTGLPYAMLDTPPNPHLKWENVQIQNVALDLGLFKNRINAKFEYYRKHVTDLISRDPLDRTTGFLTMYRNVGEIRGNGWDLLIDGSLGRGALKWDFSTSISHADEWVTVYNGLTPNTVNFIADGGLTIRPMVGKPLMPIHSYRFAGLDALTGDPVGYLNGVESKDYSKLLTDSLGNLHFHGSAKPTYFGYINNSFQYGGVTLWFNIAFRAGHYYKNETISYSNLFASWQTHGDYRKRWQQTGDESSTSVPSMIYPANSSRDSFYQLSEARIAKADVIRLQQLRISYRFSQPYRKIKGLDIGVHMDNIGILWKSSTFDKDPDYQSIPPARTVSFNLRINL